MVRFLGLLAIPLFFSPSQALAKVTNESEAGIVLARGNSESDTLNFRQLNEYRFTINRFVFKGSYLQTKSIGVLSAKAWSLGLRYERELDKKFSLFLGQIVESDIFAGHKQRYSTDLGGKYNILHQDENWDWIVEAGYRYMVENLVTGEHKKYHQARLYTEVLKIWSPTASSKYWVEYIPNFTRSEDWLFNTELSTTVALTSIFSLKTAYLLKYDNLPASKTRKYTDSLFTTSLLAKF